ncbi:hypothetical protein [Nocardia pseudovaccinii]|uniref:hypothetical protein n=1 Tax=Nocardia pseudovaccinii TaxID=189540 RepID=UPI0007A50496|nr:hypothetical protein [Nocardia pseudovaccinii]
MSETSDQDEHILEQMGHLHSAHQRGDSDAAAAIHGQLVDRFGMARIAEVMAARDDRERLGAEVDLLRLFGADVLYGRTAGPSAHP